MKVFVVLEHRDQYETGPITLVTSDEKKAEEEYNKHLKKGYEPVIEEHEVM